VINQVAERSPAGTNVELGSKCEKFRTTSSADVRFGIFEA
jgi:hypothetical protein